MLNFPAVIPDGPPMRKLTLLEYAEFNAFFLKNISRQQIERQKQREENITKRFCIHTKGDQG